MQRILRSTAVEFNVLPNQLRSWWRLLGTAVIVLKNLISMVAHLDSVELYVTVAIKKGVVFDRNRSSGCPLQYQGIEDGIVRGVIRISVPWWCQAKNRSMNKATMEKLL